LFKPAKDRQLLVWSTAGTYHPAPEWSDHLPHPVEQSRGQPGAGDAFSPGWFEVPLTAGAEATVVLSAEMESTETTLKAMAQGDGMDEKASGVFPAEDAFGQQLIRAARAFVVRRNDGKTVIAGYPWFLDWGRDSLIAARGLLAGGFVNEVRDLAIVFARFEENGTLPNTIHGGDASNRDTSDAPLWFGVVCEELAAVLGDSFYATVVGPGRRTIREVLISIAANLVRGTPNRIRMDVGSALIWSPSHFTWMDTNYPAGTPREGYPVEIQALWIRLLRQLSALTQGEERQHWAELAGKAMDSLDQFYWSEESGWYADVLLAGEGVPAAKATRDDALRSNCLAVVGLGLCTGLRARKTVEAARRYLVIPGALRSLAPLPVRVPLAIHGNHGGLLNDPKHPYWGRYEGDEDTRRKPAYHNGTAWTWTFPMFCEALALAWGFEESAVSAARGYLASMAGLMQQGCLGQIPEIVDGDAPHTQRGCDAQAWGVTEAIRVWRRLN
jgi:predicted glycogen debranching enzyme